MIQEKISLACDLCRYPPVLLDNKRQADEEGWLTISHESYYEDRSFFHSHICPNCRKAIEEQLNHKAYAVRVALAQEQLNKAKTT